MKKNYLEEMVASGYSPDRIDSFHRRAMKILARDYFPDRDSRILDTGAGSGHCLLPLADLGYRRLFAADIDPHNRSVFRKQGIDFSCVDFEKDPMQWEDGFFRAILSFHLIEHLSDPDLYLSEVRRTLEPGGIMIVVTPDWRKQYRTFWRDHTHRRPYDKAGLPRLLRCAGFRVERVSPFGAARGVGRLGLWKLWEKLMFTGGDLLVVARKPALECGAVAPL